jgi:hypothetical protein
LIFSSVTGLSSREARLVLNELPLAAEVWLKECGVALKE